jgi:hypothetical protein
MQKYDVSLKLLLRSSGAGVLRALGEMAECGDTGGAGVVRALQVRCAERWQ